MRLAAALREAVAPLASGGGRLPLAPCAALCHAALSVRSRAVCAPLLDQLRAVLQVAVESPEIESAEAADVLALLRAAAEMHAAVGLPDATVGRLLQLGAGALERSPGVQASELGAAARACSRLAWAAPEAAGSLLEALLGALERGGGAAAADLGACCRLPAAMRRRLVERLLLAGDGGAGAPELRMRLVLAHDLPALARMQGDEPGCLALAAFVEATLARLLSADRAAAQAAPDEAATLALAYQAASGVAHCLAAVEGDAGAATRAAVQQLGGQALDRLDPLWAEMRTFDADKNTC